MLLTLLACITIQGDTEPPVARIDFPLPSALTDAASIRVRGSASDASGVAYVHVNGVPASTTDGFASWWAEMPLEIGDNALVVETSDLVGNYDLRAATATVRRDAVLLLAPGPMAVEPGGQRGWLIDFARSVEVKIPFPRVVEVDFATGAMSVLSAVNVGQGPFPFPTTNTQFKLGELELDQAGTRLVLIAADPGAIYSVDLKTGDRTLLSGPDQGEGPSLYGSFAFELFDGGSKARAVRSLGLQGQLPKALIDVDLVTGERTHVHSLTLGGASHPVLGLERVHDSDMLLYGAKDALRVILGDGASELLVASSEQGLGELWGHPGAIAVDSGDRAWVASFHVPNLPLIPHSRVFKVDLSGGTYAPALEDLPGNPPLYRDVEFDRASGSLFVVDSGNDAVLSAGPAPGPPTVIARSSLGVGVPFGGKGVMALALDQLGRLLVLDQERNGVDAVDLRSGERTPISSTALGTGWELKWPSDITMDFGTTPPRALVFDRIDGVLLSVDLENGNRGLVSGAGLGSGPAFDTGLGGYNTQDGPWVVADGGTAYVLDFAATTLLENRVLKVDLATGNRSVLSFTGVGTGPKLIGATDLLLDAEGRRLFVGGSIGNAIVAVDLDDGSRTMISSSLQGTGPSIESLTDLAWDPDQGRLLGLQWGGRLLSIDALTGDRVQIAGWDPRAGPSFYHPIGAVLLPPSGGAESVLVYADRELSALCALDLAPDPTTGRPPAARTVISR